MEYVEYIAGKISQRLGLLNRIKHLLPFIVRLLLFIIVLSCLYLIMQTMFGETSVMQP